MNENHWYPRDPQRWLTDTAWCDQATEVAHNRLTDTYYALGKPIKDDPSRIQLVGKIKDVDYCRVKGCLMELGWKIEGGEWRHKRIEETMADMDKNRKDQLARTKAATEARLKQRNGERNGERDACKNPDVTLSQPQPQPQPQLQEEPVEGEREADFPEVPPWSLVNTHADRIGLPEWRAKDWFDEMEACGWLDHRGRRVCKWSSMLNRVRTRWEADGRPLKQPGIKSHQTEIKTSPGVTSFVQHKELERVSERMKTIKATYSGHQTWAEDDIEEFRKLRDRKNELKAILGVKL